MQRDYCEVYCENPPCDIVVEAVDNLLANGVTVQRRGEWIDSGVFDTTVCSECKSEWNIFDNDTYRFKYCPCCGADMRGEEHDGT